MQMHIFCHAYTKKLAILALPLFCHYKIRQILILQGNKKISGAVGILASGWLLDRKLEFIQSNSESLSKVNALK